MTVDSKTQRNMMSLPLMNTLFRDATSAKQQKQANAYRSITSLNQRQRRKVARHSGRLVCPR